MSTQTTVSGTVPQWTRGDYLRKARVSAGLTVKELAIATGISAKTINNYEADKVQPRRPTMIAWALATGVDLDWILTGNTKRPGPQGPGQDTVSNCSPENIVQLPTSRRVFAAAS